MHLGEGYKHWTTFHPDDAHLLQPKWDADGQIHRFPPLEQLERSPPAGGAGDVLAAARRLEFTIGAGDTLFIPWNTPHEVRNLTPTCAVSANFLDQSNVLAAIEQARAKMERCEKGSERARAGSRVRGCGVRQR